MTSGAPLVVDTAADLTPDACRDVARGRPLLLGDSLVAAIEASRGRMLVRLADGGPVYGVSTGMGAASGIALTPDEQERQQANLMVARAVGGAPYLGRDETRAVVVARLATFLHGDAGVSVELCLALVRLLNDEVLPAIPATRAGSAGEIIPLAHLGAAINGTGSYLDADDTQTTTAPPRLNPHVLGQKEGVAVIEGVPVATGLGLLAAGRASTLLDSFQTSTAAGLRLLPITRDPYLPEVTRGDAELAAAASAILQQAGPPPGDAALQAPVSYRIAPAAIAHGRRAVEALDAATSRSLQGVTDSPAFLDGRFTGTAGFDGFDVAACADALRVAVVHVAEVAAARLHRLLDPAFTGLPRQLSSSPGLHAGMVTVHKRAVGTVHALVRGSAPASLGAIETSLGQEDVQSFAVESTRALLDALDDVGDVLACELLALVQARRLQCRDAAQALPGDGPGEAPVDAVLDAIDAVVAPGVDDRPFGLDVDAIRRLLAGDGATAR